MLSTRARSTIGRLFFYIGAAIVAVLAWRVQKYIALQPIPLDDPQVVVLTQLQEKQLEAFLEMNSLLTTLGTAMLGALGFLLVSRRRDRPGSGDLWPAFLSGAFGGLSLFFGYAAYLGILYMLEGNFFDLGYAPILWSNRAHFYALLLGVFFLGDFATHDFNKGASK